MRNTAPRWSTEWKSAMENGTSAVAFFVVTVHPSFVLSERGRCG
jgi:hypothetical protein